jgi:hypothetical protein
MMGIKGSSDRVHQVCYVLRAPSTAVRSAHVQLRVEEEKNLKNRVHSNRRLGGRMTYSKA